MKPEVIMKLRAAVVAVILLFPFNLPATEVPSNLVVEKVPDFPQALVDDVAPYLESRSASVSDWHPTKRQLLISTRFGDTPQLHEVRVPGGARKQLTFYRDRVGGGQYSPVNGDLILFSKDIGGGEFFQFYLFNRSTGKTTLLTDGKSRNTGARWSRDGRWVAYSSTRRTGSDTDIYVIDPLDPKTDHLVAKLEGGGWGVTDWSPDGSRLLVLNEISANESEIYLADVASGKLKRLTSKGSDKVAYGPARFSSDGKSAFLVSDEASEFALLRRMDLSTGAMKVLTPSLKWDVEELDLTDDGKLIAFIVNENGIGILHLYDVAAGHEIAAPKLPAGAVSSIDWHHDGVDLAFNLNGAKSPLDVYSVNVKSGKIERWTESETGGLDPNVNVEPVLVTTKSFDGLPVSAFLYCPDARKFPGKRPVIINIHGGPEGQATPGFVGSLNYYLNELGIAVLFPNVRGSAGYGKSFLQLDNGFKREDTVKDIGAFIDWIPTDGRLDADRIGVTGGSYGGYMTLAVMTHYSDRLRAGLDVVGISNFVTFLNNTQGYRRDLRRVEYGDEREASMNAFLQKISPLTNAAKITKPLFVVQGLNDPRVPHTEAEQIVKAVRANGVPVWFLMANDEGHGFAKKGNRDYQTLASILFWKEYLLK